MFKSDLLGKRTKKAFEEIVRSEQLDAAEAVRKMGRFEFINKVLSATDLRAGHIN